MTRTDTKDGKRLKWLPTDVGIDFGSDTFSDSDRGAGKSHRIRRRSQEEKGECMNTTAIRSF
jgi:hypothetical protein